MPIMLDLRCPCCDRVLRGRKDIIFIAEVAEYKAVSVCPRCKSAVKLVEDTTELAYYYDSL